MTSNLLGTDLQTVAGRVLADATGPVYAVNPGEQTIEDLIETAESTEAPAQLRLLADRGELRSVMEDFLIASAAADLVDTDILAMRTAADLPRTQFLVTADRTIALVTAGDTVAGIAATDADVVTPVHDATVTAWDAAESFSSRSPAFSQVRESLAANVGEAVEEDFDEMLASMETARGDGDDLDEVTVSLLAAARNGVLLYDISKWGEDVGVASKATFSRTKTDLEERGLIETEKVPIDVGRPRLRLQLADDRLRTADPEELVSVAQSTLAS
ncbi:MAG: transcriptional regulator TbsP [Halobacteriaceae archaeon]